MASNERLDLLSTRIEFVSPISGFCHDLYPIYLNQNQQQLPLTVQYSLTGTVDGVPNVPILDHAAHGIRVEPILRYGRTPNTVPQPMVNSGILLRIVEESSPVADADDDATLSSGAQSVPNEENGANKKPTANTDDEHDRTTSFFTAAVAQPADQANRSIKFLIAKECLSDGGFETTVRLRLLVIHDALDLVLAFADSPRFAIMTREIPSGPNLVARLRSWGFPIHPDDHDSRTVWRTQMKPPGKRTKLVEPVAFEIDDEQGSFEPNSVCLPSGQSHLTMAGISKVVNLIRCGFVRYDNRSITLSPPASGAAVIAHQPLAVQSPASSEDIDRFFS